MAELHAQIEIMAPAERVWQILSDFPDYGDWNPLIRRARGELKEGQRLELLLEPPDIGPRIVHPTVVRLKPEREIRWVDRFGPPGILARERAFKIEALGPDRSRFVQWELVTGLFAPFRSARADRAREQGFRQMNEALKERAEQQARQAEPAEGGSGQFRVRRLGGSSAQQAGSHLRLHRTG